MTTTSTTVPYPQVPIANSELRQLKSSIVGQEYQVKIRLPEDYAGTTILYPVLYLLDGDHAFAMATDVVQYLIYGGHIPDLIIVSTAYGSKRNPDEGGRNMRNRDLLPYPVSDRNMAPGGEQYYEFFRKELIPFAESNYRILPTDRTLWGYSLGAVFALYALFKNPLLFQRLILVDEFDDPFLVWEQEYAAHHTDLPVRLFISACPGDSAEGCSKFFDRIKSRNFPSLRAEYAELNDISHFAVGAEGLTKGLVFVFRK